MAAEEPTVVFIAQLGTGGDSWRHVIDLLPGQAVLTYDRPGTGDAGPRPAPNNPLPYSAFAQELAQLLEEQDVRRKVVLVGHSFGNLIARAFADRFPDQVAGMVHVDGSIPPFHLRPTAEPKRDGDGPDATEIDVVRGHAEILAAEVPRVPQIVLTRTPGRGSGDGQPLPHPAVEEVWLAAQRQLAREANAPLLVCDDCGHQIPAQQPQLVAYAITEVMAAIREHRGVWPNWAQLERLGMHVDDGIGTRLPVGSIVGMNDYTVYRTNESPAHEWVDTISGRTADSHIRELLAAGYAKVLRYGLDGAPPEVPVFDE